MHANLGEFRVEGNSQKYVLTRGCIKPFTTSVVLMDHSGMPSKPSDRRVLLAMCLATASKYLRKIQHTTLHNAETTHHMSNDGWHNVQIRVRRCAKLEQSWVNVHNWHGGGSRTVMGVDKVMGGCAGLQTLRILEE